MSNRITRFVPFVAWLILFPLGILAGMQAAEALQCSGEQPLNPKKHWAYRLIDGRKCWYEGENNFPKALLQWPDETSALSAFGKVVPSSEDAATQPVNSPAAPNNQSDSESFEARWRALGMMSVRN
jgi:hypothetical protein